MKKSVLLFCTILSAPAWLMAQPGSLDLTFNGTGRKEINFHNQNMAADTKSFAITRDAAGNIFLAGDSDYDFGVLKLKPDGTPDNTFGEGGLAITALSLEIEQALAVALDANGNIFLAGYAFNGHDDDAVLLKLKPDGTRDNSFGTDGLILIPDPVGDLANQVRGIIINSGGDIFLCGYVKSSSQYYDMAVYKIKSNGTFDNTFDGDGKLIFSMSTEHDYAYSMVLDQNSNIVLAGAGMNNAGTTCFAVARIKPDGSFDTSFDGDGKLITAFPGDLTSFATEIVLDNNGLYLAGPVYSSPNHTTRVLKLKQDGTPDPAFGAGGELQLNPVPGGVNFYGGNMVPDANGNLILGGYAGTNNNMDFALTKVKPNGELDFDFGGNGSAVFTAGNAVDIGNAVLLDANGNIIISGFAWNEDNTSARMALLKVTPGGALDISFGNQGRVLFSAGATIDVGEDIAFDSNGNLYAAGTVNAGNGGDFGLVKLKPDGTLDNSFDGDGKVIVPMGVPGGDDQVSRVAVDAAGNIFVAGNASNGPNTDFAVLKLKPNGSPDPSFNGDGTFLVDLGSYEYVTDMLLDNNGRVYLIGHGVNGNYYEFTIIRLKADGTVDPTFDGDGSVQVSIGAANDFASAAALDSDGNIYVVGQVEGGTGDYAVIKVKPDGTLDNTFSDDGKLLIPIGSANDVARSIYVDANGGIYVGGYSYVAGGEADLSLVKLKSDGALDDTFSGDGKQIISLPNSNDYGYDLVVDGNNIYMAFGFESINGSELGVAKIKQDGTLNAAFSTNGKAIYAGMNPHGLRVYQGELYVTGSNYSGDFLVLNISIKSTQNISALADLERTYGDAQIMLSAAASSGLSIAYSSSNPSVATVSGNVVTIVGAGNTTIEASQAGDDVFAPASKSAALVVNKAVLTATADNKSRVYGQTNPAFTMTYQGFKNNDTGTVIDAPPMAGTQATTTSDVGDYDVVPSGGADNNYTFTYVKGTLTISKADQVVTFSPVSSKTLGSAAFNLSATASSSLPVVFATSSDKVSLNGAQVTLAKAGRVSIKATQTGNKNYNPATAEVSFCIDPSKPLITASFINPEAPVLTSSNNTGNQWYLNNTQLSGATNASFTASQAGTYKVQTKADDCLSEFSSDYVLVVTGVEHNNAEPVSVYPNPTTDFVRISGVSSKAAHAVSAITGVGQSLPYTFEDGSLVIDVRTLATGIYVVRFSGTQGARQVTFVKK